MSALRGRPEPEPLLAVVLWGGVFPGAKLALREIPVLSFTTLRIVLAAAVLFVAARAWQRLAPSPGLRRALVGAGLAQTVFQGLLILGLRHTTASASAILLATAPLLTAGWLALTGREQLRPQQWLGLLVGLAGVGLVVQGGGSDLVGSTFGGNVIALGAAAAWAWYGLAVGPLVGALGAIRATGWTMAVAAVVFVPLSLAELGEQAWGSVSVGAWIGLVYGATAGMVVAMSLWGRSVHRLGPRQTMLYAYLEPASAVIIAAVVLGEALSPLQAVGALLSFVGIWLAT